MKESVMDGTMQMKSISHLNPTYVLYSLMYTGTFWMDFMQNVRLTENIAPSKQIAVLQ